MAVYIVGDIHGCFDEWIELKERIEAEDSQAEFILVGDIIDRGPKTLEMLKWAMKNITPVGKYQMVIGNHEWDKIFWLERYFLIKGETEKKGGSFTLFDMYSDGYGFKDICLQHDLSDEQLMEILKWFKDLSFYKERCVSIGNIKKRIIIVHATVPRDCLTKDGGFRKHSIGKHVNDVVKRSKSMKLQQDIVWSRFHVGYKDFKNTIIVHGHTPTISDEDFRVGENLGKIYFKYNDINVDCGMVWRLHGEENGNLAALKLEGLKEQYLFQPTEEKANNSVRNRQLLIYYTLAEIILNIHSLYLQLKQLENY